MAEDTNKAVYCHFSFRAPKGLHYGIFAVAIYSDEEGRHLIAEKTVALTLWKDQQHIKAIQAYANALEYIYEKQGKMMRYGVNQVYLVTDNSTLYGWILDPNKHKNYRQYMQKALRPYRVGGPKEILISVGLYALVKYEKSHKFCQIDLICNEIPKPIWELAAEQEKETGSVKKLDISQGQFMSVADIADIDKPDVDFGT